MLEVNWTQIKAFIQSRCLSIQWVLIGDNYHLRAFDGGFILACIIPSDRTISTDTVDFEDNFKTNGNKKLGDPKDSDGTLLARTKITTTGWHYQLHGIEFETSKLNSIYSKKVDGTDYGFSSMKFYELVGEVETEISGSNLNQTYITLHCVKTLMDWEPTHDLEIIGGTIKIGSVPIENLRMWVVGVPDIPEVYGGSKPFATNVNMKFVGLEEGVKVDGRAPKYLTYSATYHTTKIRIILRHSVGFQHPIHMLFELFKG